MSLILIVVSSFLLALSGALVPGPLFTLTISESAKRGFIAGPLLILGHGILEVSIVLLILFGITPYLLTEQARFWISITGGSILLLMGGMMIKDAGRLKLALDTGARAQHGMHPVLAGILGSLSNPYWIIWWLTIGLGYLISSMKLGFPGVVAFFVGHIAADLAWYSMIALAVSRGRNHISQKGYRFMLYACGIFLIFFGVWFIISK
ncbi:MAG: lysine transporter LysE [Thermodesulfovibrio sp.]|nr:lysine transporter LysE [Thermodesulfovibrio sp.]